jgi:ubiquinone/menaquinone biosynthesis C-methylase UbiE
MQRQPMGNATALALETASPGPAAYLDRVAASDSGRAYKTQALHLLDPQPGQRVLDLGCGPGSDLSALADAVDDHGWVLGLDNDPAMLALARHRTAQCPRVRVHRADIHTLPVRDDSTWPIRPGYSPRRGACCGPVGAS